MHLALLGRFKNKTKDNLQINDNLANFLKHTQELFGSLFLNHSVK